MSAIAAGEPVDAIVAVAEIVRHSLGGIPLEEIETCTPLALPAIQDAIQTLLRAHLISINSRRFVSWVG